MESTVIEGTAEAAAEQGPAVPAESGGSPRATRGAQEPFYTLSEALPAITFIHQDGRFRYVNRIGQQMLGYSLEELLRMEFWEVVQPESRELVRKRGLDRQQGEAPPSRYEFPIKTKAGETRWLECVSARTEFNGMPAVLGSAFDITERKRAERHLNVQYAITRILSESDTAEQANPKILQALCEHLEWDYGAVWEVDPDANLLRCVATWRASPEAFERFDALNRERTIAQGAGLPGEVWASGKPAWIIDVTHDTSFFRAPTAEREGLHSGLGFPILIHGHVIGVIETFTRQVRRPDDALLRLMAATGAQVGQVVERKAAEEALHETQQRFELFMRHLPGAAWMKDAHGRYVYANETAESIFRTPVSELRGKTDDELFPPATAAHFKANDHQAMGCASYLETTETLSQQDGIHLSLVRKFPILDRAGKPILVGGIALDITERKQAEAILQESEERFRTLFDSAPIPIAVHEASGRILRTNRAYQEMLGYSDEELRQLDVKGVTHPEDISEGQRLFQELREGKRGHYQREKRFRRKDGRTVLAQSTASAVRGANGQLSFIISTVEDLTERTKADQRHRAFSELGHRLSAAASRQDAGRIIVEIAERLFGWDACYIHLYSPDGQIFPVLTIDTMDGKHIEVPHSTFTLDPSPMMTRVATEGPQLILRNASASQDSGFVPFGDKSRPSASLMYVPIHSGAKVIGILSIQSYRVNAYGQGDLDTLQALADHCGAAIDRISVADRLRDREASHRVLLRAIPDLMFRVRSDGTVLDCQMKRGDEASQAFGASVGRTLREVWPGSVVEKMMECVRKTLCDGAPQQFGFQYPESNPSQHYEARVVPSGEAEVLVIIRDFTAQRRLEQEVLTISAREQQRIGKDLHDDLGQLLTGLGFLAQALEHKLGQKSPAEASDAAQLGQLAAQALAHTRTLARGLFPAELATKGLVPALQELAYNVEKLFRISCMVQTIEGLDFSDSAMAEQVYRLVQEAVSNAVKHGRANKLLISLSANQFGTIVMIQDNGISIPHAALEKPGLGIRIMRYRARCIGADLEIRPAPDCGTTVTCAIPHSVSHKDLEQSNGPRKTDNECETKGADLPRRGSRNRPLGPQPAH
jgi:PAS domain S-box-containing protein